MSVPRYSLVFFDVDSTLVTIEGIDVLSGDNPEIAVLTEAAMSGAIPIDQVYGKRLEIVRPARDQVMKLSRIYLDSMVPGAESVVQQLREGGVDVHLVTAGIEQAVLPVAEHLGISPRAVHAVPLFFRRDGGYRGFESRSPLARARGKETVVLDVRARSHGRAMYVGDGVTDLEVKGAVDLFVGFGGVRVRERVLREAGVFVERLEEILPLVFEPESTVKRMTRKR